MSKANSDLRDIWRQRLLDAQLPEEVIDEFMSELKDEDLIRMKDMDDDEFKQQLKDALDASDASDDDEEDDEDKEDDDDEDTAGTETTKDDAMSVDELAAAVVSEFKKLSIEVEVPELKDLREEMANLKDLVTTMAAQMKDLVVGLSEVAQDETQRLLSITKDLSPAQRRRARTALSEVATAGRVAKFKLSQQRVAVAEILPTTKEENARVEPGSGVLRAPTSVDGSAIYDASGNAYANMTDMADGKVIQ